ncbi:MAG: hypothetical protein LBJ92_01105 [Holosporales bacterium]|nr:hypothetical protein [Holosporales bacterium]
MPQPKTRLPVPVSKTASPIFMLTGMASQGYCQVPTSDDNIMRSTGEMAERLKATVC